MRIFTRYIWNEVLSHALLGGALFTFILFMKYLGPLLEMAARNSASLGTVAKIFRVHAPQHPEPHHSYGRAGRGAARPQPARRR